MHGMSQEIILPRKWTVRAHEKRIIVIRGEQEKAVHPVMKALLWALYLPQFPTIQIEVAIGDHYKPDLIAQDEKENVLFWGEAGKLKIEKIKKLVKR